MTPLIIVFDYDGTLVQSNAIKRDAFSAIFPGHEAVVGDVLTRNPFGTRWEIIRNTLVAMDARRAEEEGALAREVETLADQYDRIATEGAATCPERAGVSEGLQWLVERVPLYLLSATPQGSLERIVERRGWTSCFRLIRGVPATEKADALRAFANAERVHASHILMVGDSEVDRSAALSAGTAYFHMEEGMNMQDLLKRLEYQDYCKEAK
jgi:phosphoglycolate phosphatase